MKLFRLTACAILFLYFTKSWAMVPPEYLSVPKWKNCVSTETKGTAEFVCLPKLKPRNCPTTSWNTLNRKRLIDHCSR